MASSLGFHPLHLPYVENFSAFLQDTSNSTIQKIRESLVLKLIELGEIKGNYLSFDSCNIPVKVKENNLKTSVKERFNKNKIPKRDPDCRLGVMIHFPAPFKKKIRYFWGYRNFTLSDTSSELPVFEETKPANVVDSTMLIPHLKTVKEKFNFNIQAVMADSALDTSAILSFIINKLKAKPYISKNPRRGNDPNVKVSSSGKRICMAGFEMKYWGKFKDKKQNRTRLKFVCPIIHSKKFREEHPLCPWNHPQFLKGKGCYAYTQTVDDDIREKINYSSAEFKKMYNLRTGSERIFSRLLNLCMLDPSVKGLNAVSNHCTVAHITILLIAYTAVKTGNKDKIRFVKSFVSNI